jgi:anti-anti-sigma factor
MVDGEFGAAEAEQLGPSLWLLRLIGEHDLSTASRLRAALQVIDRTGTTIVVDFSEAEFVDSSVIGALVAEEELVERLVLVVPRESPIRRTLELLGLTTWLLTFDTREEALQEASPGEKPQG